MRVTGTLYVTDHRATVRIRRGTLVIEQTGRWQRVPIESIDAVVLAARAEITTNAIGELIRRGVRVAAISRSGKLRFAIGGPVSGNVHLRIAQLRASDDEAITARLCRWIVAAKLENSRRAIQRWSWEARGDTRRVMDREVNWIADRIRYLGTTRASDKIRGIEGDGTRSYFRCLGLHLDRGLEMLDFARRTRRPPRDPVNALLSFVYGLLLTELIGALDAVGLDPQIGFLHRPRSGRPSLALDLLEEFRPSLADRFCVAVLSRKQVRAEHFQVVGSAYYLTDEGRATVLGIYEEHKSAEVEHAVLGRRVGRWMLPSVQATLLARYIRGDLPAYAPYLVGA
jgi:CRISPR-associated protein Cas1